MCNRFANRARSFAQSHQTPDTPDAVNGAAYNDTFAPDFSFRYNSYCWQLVFYEAFQRITTIEYSTKKTLLALQWLDFLLPPNQLSFYAWVVLFRGYQAGAFYPTQHFEQVINSLVKVIESHGGQVLLNQEVTNFRLTDKTVTGVEAMNLTTHQTHEFTGNTVICNLDRRHAALLAVAHVSQSHALLH